MNPQIQDYFLLIHKNGKISKIILMLFFVGQRTLYSLFSLSAWPEKHDKSAENFLSLHIVQIDYLRKEK